MSDASTGRLYALAVDRPVATTMIVVAICVFGALSYGRLGLALMPELTYPTLTVRTDYEGAAPEDVEREVSRAIEETLRTVEDLSSISSVSRAGTGDVVLEFHWGTDMDYATQKVRERIDMLDLPEGVERPLVLRYDPELDPVVRLGVTGDVELVALRRFAEDEVKRVLEKIPGVAIVRVSGGQEPIIRIELDESELAQRGLTASQVIERLRAENVNLAGGRLDDGSIEYLVRTLAEFRDLSELGELIVGWQGQVAVRLDQVGRVEQAVRDRQAITRIGERESVEIEIFKEADANIVDVAERVRLAVFGDPELADQVESGGGGKRDGPRVTWIARDLPEGMSIEVLSDRSVFIRAAIDEVIDTAFLGGVLAVIVLFLFLRSFYVTTTIALAIPLSLVVTFAALYLGGVTLNIMSLGGLALGIGMLVDNAVVVLESIHRCREEGDSPRDAAIRGTIEVGGAVVASTLTTIAVFFPIVFVEGVAGQVFGDLALAVVFSLLASLVVALFFIPTIAARAPGNVLGGVASAVRKTAALDDPDDPDTTRRWWQLSTIAALRAELGRIATAWREAGLVARVLWRAPVEVLLAPYRLVRTAISLVLEIVARLVAVVLLGVGWVLVRLGFVVSLVTRYALAPLLWVFERGFDGLRAVYERMLDGALRNRLLVVAVSGALLWGSALLVGDIGTELIPTVHQGELQVDIALPVETPLEETGARAEVIERQLAALDVVASTSSVVGVRDEAAVDSDQGANTARITVLLVESTDLAELEERAVEDVRAVLQGQPGLDYEIGRPSLFTLKTPVAVELRGDELASLRDASREVLTALQEVEGLTDVRSTLARGYPEIHVRLDRDAMASRGLSARQVADAVRQSVQGVAPTAFRTGERRLDILVRLDRSDVSDRAALAALVVKPRDTAGPAVALESVAHISPPTEGPSEIRRIEGQRVVVVEAAPDGVDLSDAVERVESALASLRLPRDVRPRIAGQSAEMDTARGSLTLALALAIFLVYIVMAARFESLTGPLVILLTIPLAGVGVVGALWLTGIPLSVVVFIGVIMLAGIVVNNAIVLVDYVIQLRDRGLERGEAIRLACSVRLRPVLITTLTTVFGLLPLALGLGEGAEIRAPMAIAVMAGLTSSTLLTLIVIPVLYDLIGEIGRRRGDREPSMVDDSPRSA